MAGSMHAMSSHHCAAGCVVCGMFGALLCRLSVAVTDRHVTQTRQTDSHTHTNDLKDNVTAALRLTI